MPAQTILLAAAGGGVLMVGLLLLRRRQRPTGAPGAAKVDPQLARDLAAGNYEAAALREMNAGNLEAAYELYLRAQKPARAAQVAQRMGKHREAAELYEKIGELAKAAALFRKAGLVRKADELTASVASGGGGGGGGGAGGGAGSSDPANAAAAAEKLQTPAERARKAEREFDEARRKAETGDGDARMRAAQLGQVAAEAWLAAGDIKRAADICRDAGLIDQAVNLYVNLLGDPGAAAPLLAERGEHRRAAELYEMAGLRERSLAAWIDWSDRAPDPLEHVEQVDRLGEDALVKLVDAVMMRRPLDPNTLDLHYRIACALQERRHAAQALPVLQRIQALSPQFRDVPQRLSQVQPTGDAAPAKPEAFDPALRDLTPPAPPPFELLPELLPAPLPGPPGAKDPTVPAPRPPEKQTEIPTGLERHDLERLVSEVAVAAAKQAMSFVRDADATGPAPPPVHSGKTLVARGIEKVDLSLRYAADSSVEAAKHGPSTEELKRIIGNAPIELANIEVYYRLGLAQMAAGQWEEARGNFSQVEKASPGYRDAGKRVDEIDQWKVAVGATQMAGQGGREANAQKAGRYTLLGELGRGGMAVVYRARDEQLGREVALKFLAEGAGDDDVMASMFQREARSVAGLNHPNIVTVYDTGVLEGRPFLCMELVDGATVENLLETQGRLKVLDALQITEQVLAALEYAHGKKIIHRDIKPANMMRAKTGLVKLMDFGLAKSTEGSNKSTVIAGTPPYMPPERLAGVTNDPRSDLFAVGVSLYEMLSGRQPYEGLRRDKAAPVLRTLNPAIPKLLEGVVNRAIEFEPDKRYASATDMLVPMRQIIHSATSFLAKRGGTPVPPGPGTPISTSELHDPQAPPARVDQRNQPTQTLKGAGPGKPSR